MNDPSTVTAGGYRPMPLSHLAIGLRSCANEAARRRMVLEFVEEYRWEPIQVRERLLEARPLPCQDSRYDALLGALGEHLAHHDSLPVPNWTQESDRFLERWWFPVDLPSVRADAIVHSPASFRRRGIFIGTGALARA
ncbi:MAG: hypothetical protein ACRDX8_06525 [Acidimicrobiales bacterium]